MADRARAFAARVVTFSQFVQNVLGIDDALFNGSGRRTPTMPPVTSAGAWVNTTRPGP